MIIHRTAQHLEADFNRPIVLTDTTDNGKDQQLRIQGGVLSVIEDDEIIQSVNLNTGQGWRLTTNKNGEALHNG